MNELITIIVPIYNRGKYLRESLDSVLNQTYKNLEIILADDGSTDDSFSIMKFYEKLDPRIKIITHKNAGICETMKRAVLISSGKYIARCDSDDINELDRYESQLNFLKKHNCDLVGCYIKGFGEGSDNEKQYLEACTNKPIRNYNEQRNRIMLGQPITGSTIMCKADVLKNIMPFKKENSIVEDFYISALFHKHGKKISILEEQKVNYRVHNNNLSLNSGDKLIKRHTEVAFEHVYKDLIENAKKVVIFKKESEKQWMIDILKKIYGNHFSKIKILTEKDGEIKLIDELRKLYYGDGEDLVFYGMSFKDLIKPLIESGKYTMYKNIFLSGA